MHMQPNSFLLDCVKPKSNARIKIALIHDELLFAAYKTPGSISGRGQNIYNCDYGQEPPRGQVCDVDIKSWAPCVQENHYNYHRSAPCIFLKLNKIFGWTPHFYNESTNLPQNMPKDLKSFIGGVAEKEPLAVCLSEQFAPAIDCYRIYFS